MSFSTYIKRKWFWTNDFFSGSLMWRHYKEIMFIIQNPKESEALRQRKLADMISFAKANTDFYAMVKGNALSDFPVINKQVVLDNYEGFVVSAEKIPGQKGKVHVQSTSGSTGTPFKVFQDTECRCRRIATIKACNELVGFHSFDLLMHFRALRHHYEFCDDILWNKDFNIIYVDNANLNDTKIQNIIKTINDNKVRFIRGYVTTMDTVTRYAVDHSISFKHHPLFIAGGEMLTEQLKDRIVKDLNCSVISQYANEENGVFGQSSINGNPTTMYLNRANCYIEILKMESDEPVEKGELGRIVVTDFTNHAMPLIRYDIGDLAKIGEVSEDGVLLSIESLAGRKTDMIIKTNGDTIDFYNSISNEVSYSPAISQWQFIQEGKYVYTLNLCLKDLSLKDEKEHFIKLVKDVVGNDAVVTVNFLDDIPVLNSGKRKLVVQNYQKA